MTRPRCVFMGTPELAVPALRRVAELCDVTCVVTQPDRPAGRGRQLRMSLVKEAALELGLPLWQPETLRGQADAVQLQDADFFVVMAYGDILRQAVLDLPAVECINIHCSLLPRWRGASPLQACIRAGDTESGVSIMRMVRALDAGPVFLKHAFAMDAGITLPQLHDQLADCAADAIADYFARYPELEAAEQDESQVTYCGKLSSADGHLDFHCPAAEVERWVRAYTPVPGCWALARQQRLRIQSLRLTDQAATDVPPGTLTAQGQRLLVACSDVYVELVQLQPPGKRSMQAVAYLNGHALPAALA